jgi:hypothetical protein
VTRLMSVALTEQAVIERRKTVTRRLNWWEMKNGRRMLKSGDQLTLCRKVMGRRPDEPLVRLVDVEVVNVRRERLDAITDAEVELEGFAGAGAAWFVHFFTCEMKCRPDTMVTRIEWRYPDESAPVPTPVEVDAGSDGR